MIIKRHIFQTRLVLPMLLASMLTACTSDHLDKSERAGEPVVFSLGFTETATRATTLDNLWPANTQVTISNGPTKYNFTTGASPSTSSSVTTSLAPVGDTFIWPINDPGWSFSAWYPAGDSPAMSQTVAANQKDDIDEEAYLAYDLLYCPPMAVSFRQRPVNLTFLHQLCRVVVIVNSTYTENKETVTGVLFGNDKIALSRDIDALATTNANGQTTWKGGTPNSTITMRPNEAMTNASNHVYTFECMLPPQASTGTVNNLIQISTTGATQGERHYNYSNSFSMLSGYQYTYNLLISEQGVITLATVKVTDWATGSPIENTATIPDNSYPATPIN